MDPMDGIEFTKLVRTAKDGRNHFVPIIMLTGFAQLERVIQARDAGVTEFLAKPFSTESLYSRIVSIVDHPRAFIRCKTYVGPDRRRRELGPRDGIADRRKAAVDAGGAMPAPEKI